MSILIINSFEEFIFVLIAYLTFVLIKWNYIYELNIKKMLNTSRYNFSENVICVWMLNKTISICSRKYQSTDIYF